MVQVDSEKMTLAVVRNEVCGSFIPIQMSRRKSKPPFTYSAWIGSRPGVTSPPNQRLVCQCEMDQAFVVSSILSIQYILLLLASGYGPGLSAPTVSPGSAGQSMEFFPGCTGTTRHIRAKMKEIYGIYHNIITSNKDTPVNAEEMIRNEDNAITRAQSPGI